MGMGAPLGWILTFGPCSSCPNSTTLTCITDFSSASPSSPTQAAAHYLGEGEYFWQHIQALDGYGSEVLACLFQPTVWIALSRVLNLAVVENSEILNTIACQIPNTIENKYLCMSSTAYQMIAKTPGECLT